MSTIYSNHPQVSQDTFLYIRGNITGFATEGGETGATGYVGNQGPGGRSDVPAVIAVAHEFGEATQPGNIRSVDVETLFDYQGVTNITAGQSIAAIRGCTTVAHGTTLGSGSANEYTFGVQGKVYLQGTTNLAAGFIAALYGQFDTSAANATATSGYHSALHLDMGATSTITTSTVINAATITNTTQCLINSAIKVIANANYLFDLSESNLTGHWVVASTGVTTQAKSLKVLVGGTAYYIPLCTGTT